MDYLSKFSIPFLGLSNDNHKFEYEIENAFFKKFENSVIQNGTIQVDLNLTRQENMLLLDFGLKGTIDFECDRCLEHFSFPVDHEYNLIIKLVDEPGEVQDENVITISRSEHSINIAPHLYDYLSLLVPYRKTHPDDENGNSTCNPEFLKKIEGLSHHEENHNDPRWEALKKLKKK